MVRVLDCHRSNWFERLSQILESDNASALLLKGCGLLSKEEKLTLKWQVLRHRSESVRITLLDSELSEVSSALALGQWLDSHSDNACTDASTSFAHLVLAGGSPEMVRPTQMDRLVRVVAQLRAPDGCPWDRVQTPESLTPYVIEEAYEAVAAIRSGDPDSIRDELGDLLLQVVLQSQIFAERGQFDLERVAEAIADKLMRRHPHVFGPEPEAGLAEDTLHQRWEKIKQAETPDQGLGDKLLHYAESLPPLLAALKISKRVSRAGFDWPEVEGIWAKIVEEATELKQILSSSAEQGSNVESQTIRKQQAAELGDLLFTLVNLGRWYGLDPAEALQETNRRFARRIRAMELLVPEGDLFDRSPAELDDLWQQAKQDFPY